MFLELMISLLVVAVLFLVGFGGAVFATRNSTRDSFWGLMTGRYIEED